MKPFAFLIRAALLHLPLFLLAGCGPIDSAEQPKRSPAFPGKMDPSERRPPGWCVRAFQAVFSPDNRLLLVAYAEDPIPPSPFEKLVLVYDVNTGQKVRGFARKDIASFAPIPASANILAVNHEGDLNIWDFTSGKLIRKIAKVAKSAGPAAISKDGKLAVLRWVERRQVRDEDGKIHIEGDHMNELWDIDKGKPIYRWPSGAAIDSAIFSPDGKWLFTRYRPPGQSVRMVVWDLATRKEVQIFPDQKKSMFPLGFGPDGKLAVSEGWDGEKSEMLLWDWRSAKVMRRFAYESRGKLPAGAKVVAKWATFSADGKRLISGGEQDMAIRCWDIASGKEIWAAIIEEKERKDMLNAVIISADGTRVFTSYGAWPQDKYHNHRLRIWDGTKGIPLSELPPLPENFGR